MIASLNDPLTQPYKLQEDQKAELTRLQDSTRDAVWLKQGPDGIEIMPRDPEGFQNLSKKIKALSSRIAHNQEVIFRLEAECRKMDLKEFSLYKLIDRRNAIPREIQKIRKEPDWDLRHIFEAASTLGNRDDAEKHPTVIVARAKASEKIRPLEDEVTDLSEKITRLEAILGEFQA
jgi:hypothetical protein